MMPMVNMPSKYLKAAITYDLVLIGQHILSQTFTSPYKIIAADINNDGQVTVTDTVEIRKLILGVYTNFPSNFSWRFVRQDYIFPDPTHPFPYPDIATFTNIVQDVNNVNFIGIKIGDVNATAINGGQGGPVYFGSAINGWVRMDSDADCVADSSDLGLEGWIVKANINGQEYLSNSQSNGYYYLPVPPGTGTIELLKPNGLWNICGNNPTPLSTTVGILAEKSFAVQPTADCARMDVQLTTPFLRRCFENYYVISYCNQGTITAENASIAVNLDPFLSITSASAPYMTQVSGTDTSYVFALGDVAVGDCGKIVVRAVLRCDAVLGQTHCSSAHVYPDSLCGPGLSTSFPNLEISGVCDGSNVIFTVTNTGADMTEAVEYVVVEDIVIQMTGGPIQLNAGETEVITLPANGSTWRLEVEQAANHPWSLLASAAIEGCGTNANGTFSVGVIPQFPQDDAANFEDEDCQTNIGAFDPNDKQGFPLGLGDEHIIRPGQGIDYLIRFQNTGTDTAFNIIVLDTLPIQLDASSISFLSSSHPCTFKMHGSNILQFVFPNIMLPDSNVNEAASHGFVKFAAQPKSNLPNGATIQNRAGIFFDFNAPVITNYTLHTVKELVLTTSNVVFQPGFELEVYPNPAVHEAHFLLKSATPTQGTLNVFDLQGRVVLTQDFDHNLFKINAEHLQTGTYFFRLDSVGKVLASGKLIVGIE
jgi:uncharacterized repeat protein (TIGR01451 family)